MSKTQKCNNNTKKRKQNKWKTQLSSQSITPLSPHQPNIQTPIIKKLGKYQFSLSSKIGSGMSGDVYIGFNTQTLQPVCIKVIDRQLFSNQKQKQLLQDQIKCQSKMKCQFIVEILDVFDTNSFCFIVTEYCDDGDLYKLIKYSQNGLTEKLVKIFGWQIATALNVMKLANIVHRDIKSQNIMIRKGLTKLGDFGFAIQQKKLLNNSQTFNLGSPLYMSLQSLQQNQYSYASDIFSYGIVLYEMLHKITPWFCNDQNQLKQRMKTQQVKFKEGLTQNVKDLIKSCLQIDVIKRITIEQVLEHDFFKNIIMINNGKVKEINQDLSGNQNQNLKCQEQINQQTQEINVQQ